MAKPITLESSISGSIWKVLVQPGQSVDAGDSLMLIESMKMEIPVLVDDPGTVVSILVKEGDLVTTGQPLAVIQP